VFALDPRLASDTLPVAELPLCRVLLMNDARFPWLILVPAKPGLAELFDLDAADRARAVEEIATASRALDFVCSPDKINIGALGNIVRQLHIHVVARHAGDPAWPGPVWGFGAPVPYTPDERATVAARFLAALRAG
jgi:diadenosine tetraphosphate (Ap4A) HIT family hydrolase